MQFADAKFHHNDAIEFSFVKKLSHKDEKVSEVAEEACTEHFANFDDLFSSYVQDLAASALAKQLNAEKVECDMHQGDKVGAITVGELTRRKDKVKFHAHSSCLHFTMLKLKPHWFYYYSCKAIINKFPEGDDIMKNLDCMVKYFSSAIANRKNYDIRQ